MAVESGLNTDIYYEHSRSLFFLTEPSNFYCLKRSFHYSIPVSVRLHRLWRTWSPRGQKMVFDRAETRGTVESSGSSQRRQGEKSEQTGKGPLDLPFRWSYARVTSNTAHLCQPSAYRRSERRAVSRTAPRISPLAASVCPLRTRASIARENPSALLSSPERPFHGGQTPFHARPNADSAANTRTAIEGSGGGSPSIARFPDASSAPFTSLVLPPFSVIPAPCLCTQVCRARFIATMQGLKGVWYEIVSGVKGW